MKTLTNNTLTTVILASGKLKLEPKGSANDSKAVDEAIIKLPDVQRFISIGKISLVGAAVAAAAPVTKSEPKPVVPKVAAAPVVKPEPKPVVVEEAPAAVVEAAEDKEDKFVATPVVAPVVAEEAPAATVTNTATPMKQFSGKKRR